MKSTVGPGSRTTYPSPFQGGGLRLLSFHQQLTSRSSQLADERASWQLSRPLRTSNFPKEVSSREMSRHILGIEEELCRFK